MSTGSTDDNGTPLQPHQQPGMMPHQPAPQIPTGGMNQQQQPPIQSTGPSPGKARLQCHACNRLLEYDAGAQYVQCFSCSTMNAVQPNTQVGGRVLSMLCAICHTTNLAPYGINYVRCGSCSTISQVSHAYKHDRMVSPQPPPPQQPTQQASRTSNGMQQLSPEQLMPEVPDMSQQPGAQQAGDRDTSQNAFASPEEPNMPAASPTGFTEPSATNMGGPTV